MTSWSRHDPPARTEPPSSALITCPVCAHRWRISGDTFPEMAAFLEKLMRQHYVDVHPEHTLPNVAVVLDHPTRTTKETMQ